MKESLSTFLSKKATVLRIGCDDYLEKDEISTLNKIAPSLVLKVKENVEDGKDPLKGMSDDDKLILLSFVVYKRQNVATKPTEIPNEEDAAAILRGKIHKKNKDIEKDLLEQLAKAGMPLKKE